MSDDRWQRLEEVFQEAADLAGPERARFLAAACDGDDGLRRKVELLLAHDQSQNDVLVAAIAEAANEWSDSRPAHDFVGKRIGPYRIVSVLGRGGMGTVYKARDSRLERDVAIKVLSEARVEGMLRVRFEREARAASALNHPNICSVYDVGEFEDHPFLVMELLEGQTPSRLHRLAAARLWSDSTIDFADRGSAGGRSRQAYRSSRHQAGQHFCDGTWRCEAARLWFGEPGGTTRRLGRNLLPAHANKSWFCDRHDCLYVARTGAGRGAGRPHRLMVARRGSL
jgi:Protein kinase domain